MPRNDQFAGRTTATSRGNEHEVTGDDMVKVRVSQQGSMIGVKTRRYGGEKRRCCTDFFCTILFGMAFGALMVVFFASVRKEPDLIDNLLYPSDSYDQHCGKSGTAVEDYPKALYPRGKVRWQGLGHLDSDEKSSNCGNRRGRLCIVF